MGTGRGWELPINLSLGPEAFPSLGRDPGGELGRGDGPLHVPPGLELFSRWERKHKENHLFPSHSLPDPSRQVGRPGCWRSGRSLPEGRWAGCPGLNPALQGGDHAAPQQARFERCSSQMKTAEQGLFKPFHASSQVSLVTILAIVPIPVSRLTETERHPPKTLGCLS